MSRKVLCLDWDKRSLRIVVARVGRGRTVLEDAHSHRLPNAVDADEPEAMGDFIRQMLRRHRLHHRSVVVDVPRERAVINRIPLPPTPPAEVAAAVRFQAMRELPFPLESAAVDYVVMERDAAGNATEVLVAAVTLETLDRVRSTCAAAGLSPTRIGLRPYANLVSVQQMEVPEDQRVLFVDCGPGATEIDVICGNTLAFARSANVNVPLPVGDSGAREDSRIISLAEISDLEGSDEAIEAAVNELFVEVTRTLQAYRATEADVSIDQVIVAGGTGVETQLADCLHQRLGHPVEMFDPTGPLDVNASEAPKLRSFSAALGLAWGVGREGLLGLDFLNPKRPVSSRETLQKRVRIGLLASAMVTVAVVGVLGWRYYGLVQRRDALQVVNRESWEDLKAKREILNRVEEAAEWEVGPVWTDELLTLTRAVADLGGRPGEKAVVQEISLDAVSSNPGITLSNLHVGNYEVPGELVGFLQEIEVNGKKPYAVSEGGYVDVPDGQKFKGRMTLSILLRELKEYRDQAKKRADARRKRLRQFEQSGARK